jgi:4'-phosphopantetheinyl transferase
MQCVMPDSLAKLPAVDVAETLTLCPGRVDLWCFFYQEVTDPELLTSYRALMTPLECARHDRFHFERDRRLFLATRALVRTVLSQYVAVDPADWRFAEGSHGKPYVHSPAPLPPLYFNLSNTLGLVVCAVSTVHPLLGVDAESLDRASATADIAAHYFSALELQALRALPLAQQKERFFAYWTLKESYIKARGLGLALPLEQFSFLLDDQPEIRIAFDPRLSDEPSRWRFALLSGSVQHLLAVGVDTGGVPLALRAIRYVPLVGALSL